MARKNALLGNRFNIAVVTELFERAIVGDDDVSLPTYVDAYRQINNFILLFGKGFSFVEKDLLEKENILDRLQAADSVHYSTVKKMISWECRSGDPSEKGSRTLLRLHRALLFVMDFLENLKNSRDEDKVCSIRKEFKADLQQISTVCQTSYERTLSRHHSWLIRKCVNAASNLLPSRNYLLNAINSEKGVQNDEEIRRTITRLVTVMKIVYARVQYIYESRNIVDLS